VIHEKEEDMPRYEVVTHSTHELDAATPEEAAALLMQEVAGTGVSTVEVHRLALWRAPLDGIVSPLPLLLRRQLAAIFGGVERSAAKADETFRTRVAAILATTPPARGPAELKAITTWSSAEHHDLSEWENEGGQVRGWAWRD
jgi:hypothetical protein